MKTRWLAFSLTCLLWAPPAWAQGIAHVSALTGDVQILPHGQTQWHAARDAEDLEPGDAVKTGTQASATVVRNDGTTVELMPLSQVTVESEEGFAITAGRLWSHFMKAVRSPFFIRTPNATALIRGTTLGVSFEGDTSRVVVYEGLVEVHGRGDDRTDVAGGFRVDIDREGRLQRLERAENRELDEGRAFRSHHGLEPMEPGGPRDRRGPGQGLLPNGMRAGGHADRREALRDLRRDMMRELRTERNEARTERAEARETRLEKQQERACQQMTRASQGVIDRAVNREAPAQRAVEPVQRLEDLCGRPTK